MTNKKYHTTLLFYLAAFFLPVLIMIGVLYSQKIYPGSERTILTSDGFHQYVIFATGLRNILHGDGSLFYTFTSGLGLNKLLPRVLLVSTLLFLYCQPNGRCFLLYNTN